jgi:hypothetical protein
VFLFFPFSFIASDIKGRISFPASIAYTHMDKALIAILQLAFVVKRTDVSQLEEGSKDPAREFKCRVESGLADIPNFDTYEQQVAAIKGSLFENCIKFMRSVTRNRNCNTQILRDTFFASHVKTTTAVECLHEAKHWGESNLKVSLIQDLYSKGIRFIQTYLVCILIIIILLYTWFVISLFVKYGVSPSEEAAKEYDPANRSGFFLHVGNYRHIMKAKSTISSLGNELKLTKTDLEIAKKGLSAISEIQQKQSETLKFYQDLVLQLNTTVNEQKKKLMELENSGTEKIIVNADGSEIYPKAALEQKLKQQDENIKEMDEKLTRHDESIVEINKKMHDFSNQTEENKNDIFTARAYLHATNVHKVVNKCSSFTKLASDPVTDVWSLLHTGSECAINMGYAIGDPTFWAQSQNYWLDKIKKNTPTKP